MKSRVGPDLFVVHGVDDGRHRCDVHPRLEDTLDGDSLGVEKVGHVAVGVRSVGHAVELQVDHVQTRLFRLQGELGLENEAQTVRRRLDAPVAELLRVVTGLEKMGRESGLAARELDRELPSRFERDRVVEDPPDLVEGELVHVAHLIRIHEAGVAHHVAAIREIHGEHRAPPIANVGRAVSVQVCVVRRLEVAPVEAALEGRAQLGVDRENVLVVSVPLAAFLDEDPPPLFDDASGNLRGAALQEIGQVALTGDDGVANLDDAARTK